MSSSTAQSRPANFRRLATIPVVCRSGTPTQGTARTYPSGTIDVDKEIDVGTKIARETETVTGTVRNKEVDFDNDGRKLESRGTIDQKV